MRRAAVNDDWGSCGAGICEPLVARFAKLFCAAHFPLAATLLVIVANVLLRQVLATTLVTDLQLLLVSKRILKQLLES